MANIKSFPNNQDVYIGAEDVMKWLHGRTSGVFAAEGNASVSALTDSTMAVTVSDGLGWMANAGKDGVVWWIDNEATTGSKIRLNIDPADSVLNRIDRIIVEWKTTNYVDYPEVKVLKGTTSGRATAPALTNNSTVRQISLAKISIAAGTTAITSSMITDERLDASVCGLVAESIRIDTSTMQNQFEELLNAIQTELQDLNNGTAALLKAGGTMYGELDMGNNKIKSVAAPEDDNDATNKKFVEEIANSKMSTVLLWENDSPTSDYANGQIPLDLANYDYVDVELLVSKASGYFAIFRNRIGSGTNCVNDNNNGRLTSRIISSNNERVSIGVGYVYNSYGTYTANNGVLIPQRIYGIKGGSLNG